MLLEEIATHIQNNGLGVQANNLFIGRLPDEPDDAIAIFEYIGDPILRTHTSFYENPRVQFLVRSLTYEAARFRIKSLFLLIEAVINTTLSGVIYQRIAPIQSPFFLQRDMNDRVIFAFNAQVMKEYS